jgi:hypothetical protein
MLLYCVVLCCGESCFVVPFGKVWSLVVLCSFVLYCNVLCSFVLLHCVVWCHVRLCCCIV